MSSELRSFVLCCIVRWGGITGHENARVGLRTYEFLNTRSRVRDINLLRLRASGRCIPATMAWGSLSRKIKRVKKGRKKPTRLQE